MSLPSVKVLLVDSNDEAREAIAEQLRAIGCHQLREAEGIKQAVEALNEQSFDLILSDWELPGASGFALLKLVKLQSRFEDCRFILTSALGPDEETKIRSAADYKVDGYLLKPFHPSTLIDVVLRVLGL